MPRRIFIGGRWQDSHWAHNENYIQVGLRRGKVCPSSLGHEMAHAHLGHFSPRPRIESFVQELEAWNLALSRTNERWPRASIRCSLGGYAQAMLTFKEEGIAHRAIADLLDKHKDKLI